MVAEPCPPAKQSSEGPFGASSAGTGTAESSRERLRACSEWNRSSFLPASRPANSFPSSSWLSWTLPELSGLRGRCLRAICPTIWTQLWISHRKTSSCSFQLKNCPGKSNLQRRTGQGKSSARSSVSVGPPSSRWYNCNRSAPS